MLQYLQCYSAENEGSHLIVVDGHLSSLMGGAACRMVVFHEVVCGWFQSMILFNSVG